jgi:hypothetical protein
MCDLPYGGLQKVGKVERTATDLERFKHMDSTVSLRLTPGKSGIHGMGVFARVPISTGDWVIEYVGVHFLFYTSALVIPSIPCSQKS